MAGAPSLQWTAPGVSQIGASGFFFFSSFFSPSCVPYLSLYLITSDLRTVFDGVAYSTPHTAKGAHFSMYWYTQSHTHPHSHRPNKTR